MRKLVMSAFVIAILACIAGGSAYAVLEQPHLTSFTPSSQEPSIHTSHDGGPLSVPVMLPSLFREPPLGGEQPIGRPLERHSPPEHEIV